MNIQQLTKPKITNLILLIIICICKITYVNAQSNGFYINTDIGIQPFSTISLDNKSIVSEEKQGGHILLGIAPSYQFNNSFHLSAFYVFEGHDKPIPATSAFGFKGFYFLKGEPQSPFIDLGIGRGTAGNIGNGNNGVYLNPDIGFQFHTKRKKKHRVSLGYSMQFASDYDYSDRDSITGIETDAITHSIKLYGSFMIFRSNKLK